MKCVQQLNTTGDYKTCVAENNSYRCNVHYMYMYNGFECVHEMVLVTPLTLNYSSYSMQCKQMAVRVIA